MYIHWFLFKLEGTKKLQLIPKELSWFALKWLIWLESQSHFHHIVIDLKYQEYTDLNRLDLAYSNRILPKLCNCKHPRRFPLACFTSSIETTLATQTQQEVMKKSSDFSPKLYPQTPKVDRLLLLTKTFFFQPVLEFGLLSQSFVRESS